MKKTGKQHPFLSLGFYQWIFHIKDLSTYVSIGTVVSVGLTVFKNTINLQHQDILGLTFIVQVILITIFLLYHFSSRRSSTHNCFACINAISGTKGVCGNELQDCKRQLSKVFGFESITAFEEANHAALRALKQFNLAWVSLWIAWLCQYLLLTFGTYFQTVSQAAEIARNILLTIIDGWSTLSVAIMFVILSRQTVIIGNIPTKELDIYKLSSASSMWIFFIGLSVFLGICSHLFDFSTSFSWLTYLIVLFSVIVSAVAMGSFAGRLTSKFLSIPPLMVTMLFFYAALQMHNPQIIISLFNADEQIIFDLKMQTYMLSGILKSLFFLIITWTLFTGRMHLYLLQTRILNFQIEKAIGELNNFPLQQTH